MGEIQIHYAKMDEKEARRAYREEHGIAKERKAFCGLHHIGNVTAVRLGLATGMRRGEVFAVTWENVDLDRRTIRVCQSITYQRKVKTPNPRPASALSPSMLRRRHISPCGRSGRPPSSPRSA